MSVVSLHDQKVVLPRGPQLWETLEREWCRGSQKRWKRLAIVQLHVYCGWHFNMIALAFGHRKGHVVRTFYRTLRELKDRFQYSAPFLDDDGGEVSSTPDRSSFLQGAFRVTPRPGRLPARGDGGRFVARPDREAA